MDHHDQIHNDIKPQNYLVKFPKGENGKRIKIKSLRRKAEINLSGIEIVLTDFGLAGADSKGGTPIFASPECLASRERKNKSTDIFSLGRVFLFMLLPKETFLEFLFVPLIDGGKARIMKLIKREPIFRLIAKMMRIKKRVSLRKIRRKLHGAERIRNLDTIAEIRDTIKQSTSECSIQYISNLKHFS